MYQLTHLRPQLVSILLGAFVFAAIGGAATLMAEGPGDPPANEHAHANAVAHGPADAGPDLAPSDTGRPAWAGPDSLPTPPASDHADPEASDHTPDGVGGAFHPTNRGAGASSDEKAERGQQALERVEVLHAAIQARHDAMRDLLNDLQSPDLEPEDRQAAAAEFREGVHALLFNFEGLIGNEHSLAHLFGGIFG
jgi:hypothetical protein